jgi:hypothetical protein
VVIGTKGEIKMKKYILLLIIFSFMGHGFVIWPNGSAPCNGTLQACIDASVSGEYIQINTNGPINEDLVTNKVVSLVAGKGYKPVFSSGNKLIMDANTAGGGLNIQIKDLTFDFGYIDISTIGGAITFIIENNTINSPTNKPAIEIYSATGTSSETNIHVNFNQINTLTAGPFSAPYGAIFINKSGIGLGPITGEIYNNTIRNDGLSSKGISVYVSNNADIDLNITANVIYGGNEGGIFASRTNSSSGLSSLDITSNAFYRAGDLYDPSGIHIINDTGITDANIINNTMIENRFALFLKNGVGTFSADVFNNLIAYGNTAFDFDTNVTVTNNNNLYYQNSLANNNYVPGSNAMTVNPKIYSRQNARLTQVSPARESGNGLAILLAADAHLIEADGLLRIKNSSASPGSGTIDIGAYEAGDVNFVHSVSDSSVHISAINSVATDNQSSLDNLHVTSNWNYIENSGTGIYNNDNEALFYTSNQWYIFNEGITNFNTNASFNVSKFASNGNTFMHAVSIMGENNSTINNSTLNTQSGAILQVTQHWTGVYNPHPFSVLYLGAWVIINNDLAEMPVNSNFNVYYQDRSKSAFVHTAKGLNIFNTFTLIDHPLINGVPCAQIQVTQNSDLGVFNNSPIGLYYNSTFEQWAIINQNVTPMPENAAFHVLINPEQIELCSNPLLFMDGFE